MKLTTEIKPRKDGTVKVHVGGHTHVFTADSDGMLSADIPDDEVGYLLDTGNFYPANEGDIEAGIAAIDSQGAAEDANEGDIEAPAPANAPKQGKKKGA